MCLFSDIFGIKVHIHLSLCKCEHFGLLFNTVPLKHRSHSSYTCVLLVLFCNCLMYTSRVFWASCRTVFSGVIQVKISSNFYKKSAIVRELTRRTTLSVSNNKLRDYSWFV